MAKIRQQWNLLNKVPAAPRLLDDGKSAVRKQEPGRPYNVLFLCTGNSARSIFGEAVLNKIGKGKFLAYSAGSWPKGDVNPHALALLQRLGFSTSALRSKSWDEFARPDAPKMDFVFTVCDNAANEVCPVWPGQPITAHWGVPDPAAATGDEAAIAAAFRDALSILRRRIELFANLPVKSLDRMSLKRRVDAIGSGAQDHGNH
jgi:arsenate reductase